MQTTNIQDLTTSVERDVRGFIAENLTFSDDPDELDAELSMLETDIIDSTSILELVAYLEERFGIEIADSEVVPANLDSLRRIANFVAGRLTASLGAVDFMPASRVS